MSSRLILITGGSGKFGLQLTQYFLNKGDRVIFTTTSDAGLQKVQELYKNFDGSLFGFIADFTNPHFVHDLLEQLDGKELYPDSLINNARSLNTLKVESTGRVSRDNFADEYLIDVIAPYELITGLAEHKNSQLQSIVNIGSQYGVVAANPRLYDDHPRQSPIHYGVAKAALIQLTRELAVRLAGRDIQVNCVAFGGVEGRVDEAFKQRYAELTPMGRMLTLDEITGPIDFMLSGQSSGMTGQVVQVDGGWSIW